MPPRPRAAAAARTSRPTRNGAASAGALEFPGSAGVRLRRERSPGATVTRRRRPVIARTSQRMCARSLSFSVQKYSIKSVFSAISCGRVIVHGRVYALGSSTVISRSMVP